jgi:class 3 adenylate cyclase
MDVAAWLRGLGLEQYAQLFRDNDIDGEILCGMTAEDLRELGVSSFGHRRRLVNAIAGLEGEPTTSDVVRSAASAMPAPASPPPVDAERRQLTVMFCDLVGSTALSTRLDPEDLRELIGHYHRAVADTVDRFDGFVAKYMGDGVLIYFGYPRAHEDDAERAVRAGLAVIEAVARLPAPQDLRVRLGVATGLAVVGDLLGEGAAQERGVVGETPNLAARVQGLAKPNTVVIADATRRQIGGLFVLADLGPRALAGFAEPQRAWRVIGEGDAASRFEALRSDASPLVGRDEELELVRRRWQQAKVGEGRVVLISGEPGIGKSRLTAALAEGISDESHRRLRWFCSPHHQDGALHPMIAQLERAAGFARDDPPDRRLAKARELLASAAGADFELLAELLSLPNTASDLTLSPKLKRERLFEALLLRINELVRTDPVLVILEDAHWIDPTSRELLDLLVDRVRALPVLLIVTFRPEFQPPWAGLPHVTNLGLSRLGGRDVAALVREVAGNTSLDSEIVAEIVERTDGVPLFVEELTKVVLEQGAQGRVEGVLAASPAPSLAVPATLHASLVARLDGIGAAAREVAQIGAVLGRDFSYEMIAPVAQQTAAALDAALAQLDAAGLLFSRGVPPASSHRFKHALVQDAAYSMLLRGRRQTLHARVATVLEEQFPDLLERQPELLAYHLTEACNTERAVDQWLKAGRHAAARFAPVEAIARVERGLATLAALPKGPSRDGREIDLQLARGSSLFAAEGYSSGGAAEAYARARQLAEQRGDPQQLFMAVYGLWQSANGAGKILDCRRLSNRLRQLTAGTADDDLILEAHHSAWATSLFAGKPVAAQELSEAGRRLYDPERHRSHHLLYGGHDPGVCAGKSAAAAHWLLGFPDKALVLESEALALAERIAHPFSRLDVLLFTIMFRLNRGEPALALRQLEAAEALAAEQRLGFNMEPRFLRGAILSAQGAFDEGSACLREGLVSRLGAMRHRVYGLAQLADTLTRNGKHSAGLDAAREGLETGERTGHRQWKAELHRLEGVALSGLNRLEEGQIALEEALHVARKQHAKAYELRAATSLARLWGEQGRHATARDLLAPVYGWFTEGFDTIDLKEAKALLEELT